MKTIRDKKMIGSTKPSILLLMGVLVIGGTLRAPITVVGPLMDPIRQHFDLGAGQAGLLTALPLLAFAVMSPLFGRLGRAFGLERVLFAGMCIVATGIMLRSSGTQWALFAGTWFIGSGLAAGNVLLPSLIKRDFAGQIARTTAGYTLAMALAAALASAVVTPIAQRAGSGWDWALASVMVLPVLALALWVPQLSRSAPSVTTQTDQPLVVGVWRSSLAWQISLFMGLNSVMYYVAVSWLSSVLVQAGFSHTRAGLLQGGMHLASALTAAVIASLGRRANDQRRVAHGMSMCTVTGFAGVALAPSHAVVWTCLLGIGIGAGMIQALSFLSLRASSAPQVAALSGMAQCVGYLLGAAGPPVVGMLREMQGGWTLPLLECAALGLVMARAGWLAGRDVQIDAATAPPSGARPRPVRV
jgi:CP family cyanate transporter-like MFS transporter